MSDSIVRLKVESQEYDQKLKRAQEGLTRYADECRKVGGTLEVVEKDTLDYVKALGQMDTVSRTATGKLAELKKTFTELSVVYKDLSKEEKQSPFGKALAASLDDLKPRIMEAKRQLDDINKSISDASSSSGGGLFAGLGDKMSGALQVFAGNMLTKAAGAVASLGSEMVGMVQQGVQLAKQGDGIRIAFERLGRGDILNGLREATHGTVTDLELMKAAVKFNDFKLPLDELGTMLAFAQQKAKDTGQSVDYMVDSIVTGLGRKSLMILDNLGLSATEVKEKMKETGDMTKAVGEIIREQMSKAGDYVETAADRATQADVKLKNAMEDLGRTFEPLTSASDNLWNSIKVGALNALNTAVKPLIQALAEAGTLGQSARSSAGFNNLGGNSKVDRMIGRLGNGKSAGAYSIYQQQLGEFDKFINNKRFQIAAYGNDNSSIAQSAKTRLQTEIDGALKMRAEYVKRAQELHNQVPSPFEPASTSGSGDGRTTPEYIPLDGSIDAQTKKVQELQKAWRAAADDDSRERIKKQIDDAQLSLDYMTGKAVVAGSNSRAVGYTFGEMFDQQHLNDLNNVVVNLKTPLEALEGELKHLTQFRDSAMTGEQWQNRNRLVEAKQNEIDTYMGKGKAVEGLDLKKIGDKMQGLSGGLASLTGGLKQMGIEIPQEVDQVIGVIQGLSTIIQGMQSVIQIFSTSSQTANTIALNANTAALWAVATTNAIPFAGGGIIPHAADGYFVPGNNFSGDITPIMANAGELVLNRAQQGNLASQLQGGGMGGWKLTTKLAGTDLLVSLERTLQKQGYGRLATWQ